MQRRSFVTVLTSGLVFITDALAPDRADAQAGEKVVRYGISMVDIPLTTGQPDYGAGGYQFSGHTIYDPLVAWEMNVADRPGKLVPGLATEWKIDPVDKKRWIFPLRRGVRFHDGSAFTADAVIWNLDKVLNNDAPHFDARQAGQVRPRMSSIAGYRKLDDYTVEIMTKEVNSLFPYEALCWFLISSPVQYEKLGRNWNKFAFEPSGTGPFKLTRLVPRELAELVRNPDYWDKSRIPKLDRIILMPIPDVVARTNALLSGQVDLIEGPAPDMAAKVKLTGNRIVENVTPHVWNYHFSLLPDSPWIDIRLRRALNLAIDRAAIVKLLNGFATPAKGQLDKSSQWFGKPTFDLKYDPAEAKRLVAAAGYSTEKPLKVKFVIPSGGTGQMLSLPMNEFIQQAAAEIGIQIEFQVVELEAAYVHWRKGAKNDVNKGITASNIAYVTSDPVYALVRFLDSKNVAPAGVNWGWYSDPKTDALITEVKNTFDLKRQDEILVKLHETFVDEALLCWVVHDTNPHALSPKVKQFVQAQHWLQDLTTIGVD